MDLNIQKKKSAKSGFIKETLENLKVGPHRILTPLSQQGFSKGRDWGGGGFPVFPQEVAEEEQDNQLLFRRTTLNQEVVLDLDSQLSGENESIRRLTRPNSLFLSAAAQNNHLQLLEVYKYFFGMIFIKQPESVAESSVADRVDECRDKEKLKDILKQADIGITDITVRETELSETQVEIVRKMSKILSKRSTFEDEAASPNPMRMKQLNFIHSTADGEPRTLGYDFESRGTQVFLTLLLPALEALSEGSFLVIDELDTSLHPDLSRAFLSLFHRKASNPHGAQLLFSTHDVTLGTYLPKCRNAGKPFQYWLFSKNLHESTEVKLLSPPNYFAV